MAFNCSKESAKGLGDDNFRHQKWDIMASASSTFGPSLYQALSAEWEAIQFSAYATVATEAGRRQFLSSIKFSNASARLLYSHLK